MAQIESSKPEILSKNSVDFTISVLSLVVSALLFVTCYSLWDNLGSNDFILRLALVVCVALETAVVWIAYPLEKDEAVKLILWIALVLLVYGSIGLLTGDFGTRSILLYFILLALVPIYLLLMYKAHYLAELLRTFVGFTAFFAALSLLIWLLGPILGIINPDCSIANSWNGVDGLTVQTPGYFNLLYTPQIAAGSFAGVMRNTGIFTESPMYSYVLCSALFIEFFLLRSHRKWVALLLVVTIFTTFSTTGIVLCLCVFYGKWFINASCMDHNRLSRMLVALIFLFVMAFLAFILLEKKSGSASALTRIDDFSAGMKAWLISPFYGNGLTDLSFVESFMSSWRLSNAGFSNGLFSILARGGLVFLLLYLIPAIGFFFRKSISVKVFGLLFLVMLVFTIANLAPITAFILSIGTASLIKGCSVVDFEELPHNTHTSSARAFPTESQSVSISRNVGVRGIDGTYLSRRSSDKTIT